jgi:hypothetical protein
MKQSSPERILKINKLRDIACRELHDAMSSRATKKANLTEAFSIWLSVF